MNQVSSSATAAWWIRIATATVVTSLIATVAWVSMTPESVSGTDHDVVFITHAQSEQNLLPDGWGPAVLASEFDGPMAQWEVGERPDGTIEIVNAVTGEHLGATGSGNSLSVEMLPATGGPSTGWTRTAVDGGVHLVMNGRYLIADGFKVRLANQPGGQAVWSLVDADRQELRSITLTNVESNRLLGVSGPAEDGLVITADAPDPAPVGFRWELIEQTTTSKKCDRHPAWNRPNDAQPGWGDESRLTTCHVLRSRSTDQFLTASSEETAYAVGTVAVATYDTFWVMSDVADGSIVNLENIAFARYLAEPVDEPVTTAAAGADAEWRIDDIAVGCDELDLVRVDSHENGDVVDIGAAGTGTGSFVLFGVAPPDSTAVEVVINGETGQADVEPGECSSGWSIEATIPETQTGEFLVRAVRPVGEVTTTVTLDLIAPSGNDVLIDPDFLDTPQFPDLLLSYDDVTGVLVFAGDVSNDLQPGDGLVGGISAAAPSGYLKHVVSATFDGENTVVETVQAGLTDYLRQVYIDVDQAGSGPLPTAAQPVVAFSAEAPVAPAGTASPAPEAAMFAAAAPDDPFEAIIEFKFDPTASLTIDIDLHRPCFFCPIWLPSLEEFSFEAGIALTAQAEVTVRSAGGIGDRIPIGQGFDDYKFATVTIPTPLVPVILEFELDSQPYLEWEINAFARLTVGATFSVVAGFEYLKDQDDRGAYSDADVDLVTPGFDAVDFGILGRIAAGVEIDIEALVYGQAGIALEIDPELELEVIGDLIGNEITADLVLKVPVGAGIEIEINLGPIGWESDFGDLTFVEISLLIWQGTFEFTKPDVGVQLSLPPGAFPGQTFTVEATVSNDGESAADDVSLALFVPEQGSFVSVSSTAGDPTVSEDGASIVIAQLEPNESERITLRWRAPTVEGAILGFTASAQEGNGNIVIDSGTLEVGTASRCNPCGVSTAGVGLRNRDNGTLPISGLPAGAEVTRAVLVWGVLYRGAVPQDTITFDGTIVTADVAATVSGNLCWGDSDTIGYAADVTDLVSGNGDYVLSGPPAGLIRVDDRPAGVLPYTDGASLIVFYVGGGANSQIISDFSYGTNTIGSQVATFANTINRTFEDITSVGSGATLTLAGPDGQNNATEQFTLTGDGSIVLSNTWDGSAPQAGPAFQIGSLWDNDTHDVSAILPAGQSTMSLTNGSGSDCIGIAAAVLEVEQS